MFVEEVTGDDCSVERLALEFYEFDNWRGVHCETGLYLTLFGLIMWDIIFAPIPDVFQHEFQVIPPPP